jgi:hypothetical protein
MKIKKFGKKLDKKIILNKKTIANLNNVQLFNVRGGIISLPALACVFTTACVTNKNDC